MVWDNNYNKKTMAARTKQSVKKTAARARKPGALLQENEARFVADEEGRIVYVTRAFAALINQQDGNAKGQPLSTILAFDNPDRALQTRNLFGTGSRAYIDALNEGVRSEEHTSELQSRLHLVCRLLLE